MADQSRELRNALGCFATGICIITTRTVSGLAGLTANSFASVSLDPPLVLFSLDKASDTFSLFQAATHFCINVLQENERDLSARMARKGRKGLEGFPSAQDGAGGAPVLDGALAHFECAVHARHDGGDHVIYVGRVLHFAHARHGHPLIYYRGHYRTLAPMEKS